MKGISLAIETIVFIILAVTVLTVLLFFFTATGGRSQYEFELQQKRHLYCGRYASIDQKCTQDGYQNVLNYDKGKEQKDQILYNIAQACTGLKLFPQYCNTATKAELPCVQACCIQCPKSTI
jgi:hypothetical protein